MSELIRKSDVAELIRKAIKGISTADIEDWGSWACALADVKTGIDNMPPVKIVEMSNNQMLKDLIDRLTYYGTTYAIGDNLGREIDGTDELMLEAAERLGNCVELPCKTITEEESKKVVEEWINE